MLSDSIESYEVTSQFPIWEIVRHPWNPILYKNHFQAKEKFRNYWNSGTSLVSLATKSPGIFHGITCNLLIKLSKTNYMKAMVMHRSILLLGRSIALSFESISFDRRSFCSIQRREACIGAAPSTVIPAGILVDHSEVLGPLGPPWDSWDPLGAFLKDFWHALFDFFITVL